MTTILLELHDLAGHGVDRHLGGALARVEYLDFVHQTLAFQLEVNRTHLAPLCLGACDSTAASASVMSRDFMLCTLSEGLNKGLPFDTGLLCT